MQLATPGWTKFMLVGIPWDIVAYILVCNYSLPSLRTQGIVYLALKGAAGITLAISVLDMSNSME